MKSKSKSFNEFLEDTTATNEGVTGAAFRKAATGAGKVIGKVASGVARNVGRVFTKHTFNTLGINLGAGVAIEAGAEALDKKHLRDARKKRQAEFARATSGEPVTESIRHEPPVVLILKRKAIRLYPQGEKIALYRNDKLGVNFAVPYDDVDDAITATSDHDGVGGMSEGIEGIFKGVKSFASSFKKGGSRSTNYKTYKQAWDNYRKHADAVKAMHKVNPKIVASPGKAVAAGAGAALATGYVVDTAIDKYRSVAERPNKKRHGGSPVYEAKYGIKVGSMAKAGVIGGLAYGGARIAYDVAKDIAAGDTPFQTDKYQIIKGKKKVRKKKLVVQEARHKSDDPPGNRGAARKPNSFKPPERYSHTHQTPVGYKRGRLRGAGRAAIKGSLLSAVLGAGAGIAMARFQDKRAYQKSQKHGHKQQYEEVELQQEFFPAIAAAVGGAVGRVGVGLATRGGVARTATTAGKYIAKQAAIGGATGVVANKITTKLADKKAATAASAASNPEDGSDTQETKVGRVSNTPNSVEEATASTRMTHMKTKIKRTWIPKGLGKELVKGGAIALGASIATKAIDVGYDAWRDHAEVKKASQEAREKAKAEKAVGKHVTVRTTVRREVQESRVARRQKLVGYQAILDITNNGYGHVHHDDGTKTKVDHYTAAAIKNVHDALSPDNQKKLQGLVSKNRAGLTKIADFSFKQHNKGHN